MNSHLVLQYGLRDLMVSSFPYAFLWILWIWLQCCSELSPFPAIWSSWWVGIEFPIRILVDSSASRIHASLVLILVLTCNDSRRDLHRSCLILQVLSCFSEVFVFARIWLDPLARGADAPLRGLRDFGPLSYLAITVFREMIRNTVFTQIRSSPRL